MKYKLITTYVCKITTVGEILNKLSASGGDQYCMSPWDYIDPKEPVTVFPFITSWGWFHHRRKNKKIWLVKDEQIKGTLK